jgi:hypothetical protein
MKTFLTALALIGSVLAADPKPETSTIKGNLTTNGVTKALTHVGAFEVQDKDGDLEVVIVFSDRELKREEAINSEKLEAMMSAKKLTALKVVLNSNCRVNTSAPYSPAMRNFVSTALYVRWEPTAFDEEKVAGRFFTAETAELGGEKWSYDITFSTPMTLLPGAVPAKAKPAPAPEPKPIPVKGVNDGLIIRQTIETNGSKSDLITSVKGAKVSVDMGKDATTITDTTNGDTTNLMHQHKMMTVTPGTQMKAIMDAAMSKVPSPAPQALDTGKKETINGIECAIYTMKGPDMESTFWVTDKYPDQDAMKEDLATLVKAPGATVIMTGIPGIVVKCVTKSSGSESTITLVSMKEGELNDRPFQIPSWYKKVGG